MKLLLIDPEAQSARMRVADLAATGFSVDWIRMVDEDCAGLLEGAGYDAALMVFQMAWTDPHWRSLEHLARMRVPVLIAGPRSALPWIERVLEAGAADFLIEPADPQDLALRIRVCARRGRRLQAGSTENAKSPKAGSIQLRLNPVQRTVIRNGAAVSLTQCEYLILAILMSVPGRIVPRDELEQQLYAGGEEAIGSNTVEVYIHNLRRKLGSRLIRTARGRGYWVDAGECSG